MKYMNKFVIIVIASCFIGLTSCASVPEETVQLSEAVGKDIQQLYTGYRATVRLSFEQMRQNGLAIIDKLWTPKYLEVLISEGVLDVCAEIEKTAEKTDCIEYWAQGAINDIDEKRKGFLQDIDVKEAELLATIDEAFDRTIRANAAVTPQEHPQGQRDTKRGPSSGWTRRCSRQDQRRNCLGIQVHCRVDRKNRKGSRKSNEADRII
jgi:hypothetical protein